ncbi:MAG TPA: diadenylate cyclase CdaA [Bryobacteraceae bacterium]|nr:diadenylate cyclase CdaA [Bryobacteraceae bacterium]
MPNFAPLTSWLSKLSFSAVIDILIVAFLMYELIMVVKGTRAASVLAGIGVLLLAYVFAIWARLELLRSILAMVVPYTAIAVIVLFQSEIRRTLARIGRRRWLGFGLRLQRRESTEDILLALGRLSQQKIGALIVVERDTGLRTFVESGVALNANVSRDLLLSIFQPGGALHDGAVIVQGDRIAAAACFLPLSMNPLIARKLGTRHRAAIGVTEEADCLALVVSEETGRISVAAFGELEMDLSVQRVDERFAKHFGRKRVAEPLSAFGGPPAHHAGAENDKPLMRSGWNKAGQ